MSELTDHVTLMQTQRAALSDQIAKLHDGQKKADLKQKLADIEDQLDMIARASATPAKALRGKGAGPVTRD